MAVAKRRRKAVQYNLKRFANFITLFLRNRKGAVGLAIIAVFAVIAFFPSAFTSYDPVKDVFLSGFLVAPTWLRHVPSELGGSPNLSENYLPNINGGFENLTSGSWNLTGDSRVTVQYEQEWGGHSGIAHFSFRRNEVGTLYGNITTSFFQEFYYPYAGPPSKFFARIIFFLNGSHWLSEIWKDVPIENLTDPFVWPIPKYLDIDEVCDVPVKITVFFETVSINQTLPIWPLRQYYAQTPKGMEGMVADGTYMKLPEEWVDSDGFEPINSDGRVIDAMITNRFGSDKPASYRFFPSGSCPGNCKLGIEVTFGDTKNATVPVYADVYLDTLDIRFQGSSWGLMGTDRQGRDLFSQLVYGARISLYVGVLSSILAVGIGLIAGLMAGYLGKVADELIMRVCDILLVLPGLPLLIVLVAVLGATVDNLIILLGLLGWMGFARLVRSQVISLRERPFIEAAKAVGAGKVHIMFRHILPNVLSLVYVSLATTVPNNIVTEASLGFLGFSDPSRMSWGLMLNNMQEAGAFRNWWWVVPPGLCIAAVAVAFILLGFALDATLNPRLRLRK